MIAETRSYIFRWRFPFRRRRVCLNSLLLTEHAACKWTGGGAVEVNIENERITVVCSPWH